MLPFVFWIISNIPGRQFKDLNLNGEIVESDPFALLLQCARKGTGGVTPAYFHDMIHLFKQFSGHDDPTPHKREIFSWMDRYTSGLDPEVIRQRKKNKLRILKIIIKIIDDKRIKSKRFCFKKGMSRQKKLALAKTWWKDHKFHLKFAVRTPENLNEMLGFSLDRDVMNTMKHGSKSRNPLICQPILPVAS